MECYLEVVFLSIGMSMSPHSPQLAKGNILVDFRAVIFLFLGHMTPLLSGERYEQREVRGQGLQVYLWPFTHTKTTNQTSLEWDENSKTCENFFEGKHVKLKRWHAGYCVLDCGSLSDWGTERNVCPKALGGFITSVVIHMYSYVQENRGPFLKF